ncbi:hypothetical protein BC939DRAFT_238194 [Gamsiella multidivaricata]|uniref:uncharacterized protein n=1 Tax=Gamsiella multidivaricata TaxID=101098 RepID=UPI00221E6E42|nr:uncharacterized protein BC939DRAFT_238194 [Gamsiella multidivaricata]KAI7820304.1 hypothetical protein BC939DRAFT_238194 [Gamsiella multidivaricata]
MGHHDEEEEKIVSAYQVLNLIIPDISEAAAAAEAAEQLELEQQQQQQQQLENESGSDTSLPMASQSTTSSSHSNPTISGPIDIGNSGSNINSNSNSGNSSSPNEKTMSEFLRANMMGATDYLAVTSLGIGAGLIPATVSGSSTRPGTSISTSSSSALNLNIAESGTTNATVSQPATSTLAARFRLPFSSRAFIPPSRPASVHQLNNNNNNQQQGQGETSSDSYAGSSNVLGINNPMQSSANLSNSASGIRSSFFDYRLTNLLQFGAGSSIAGSVRSFDPMRTNTEEDRQDLYEVEFNAPPDPAQEEARRMDRTVLGRMRKVLRSGFPGRDLDPRTRKPRYKYPTNNIKTTKYTLVTFLPVNLLFQVKYYFLVYSR